MSTAGKSLALFPEDELAPAEPASGSECMSSGVESNTAETETRSSVHQSHACASESYAEHPTQRSFAALPDQDASSVRLARAVQPTLEEQAAAQSASERAQLWLALKFVAFPLEVLCRDAVPESATVVVADNGGRSCVVACDQQAYDHGVRTRMPLAAAYALVHELEVLARDEAQELAALERLATWAKKFTPLVSLCNPDALLLEVRGSLMLFGGIEGLLSSVQHDLRMLGFVHAHAVAPAPTAALWLAQYKQGVALDDVALKAQLGRLPIAVTAWPERVLSRLQGMGVRTLRDCLRLPRDGFARRIGRQHLKQLDQALGLAPDPRVNYQPPDKFVARRELLFALESVTMIMRGLDQLLVELCSFLRGRQSGVQALRITLYHAHATASVLHVGTASACREHTRLVSLVHEKIEQLVLPEGVVAISMVSGRLYPLTGFDGQLFSDAAHSDVPWPQLVEKLRARLGARAVTGLCLVPEHRPEQAWKYTEPGTASSMPVPGLRPLWLLAQPHQMTCRHGKPYWHGPLTVMRGPERIESGWWDGNDAARDYFVVVNPYQLMLWVYRERSPSSDRATHAHYSRAAVAGADAVHDDEPAATTAYEIPPDPTARWYVHGLFA